MASRGWLSLGSATAYTARRGQRGLQKKNDENWKNKGGNWLNHSVWPSMKKQKLGYQVKESREGESLRLVLIKRTY